MRIAIQIEGHRNNDPITVPVSLTDENQLTFEVPTVNRANACTFSVDLKELREAIRHLEPNQPSEMLVDSVDAANL